MEPWESDTLKKMIMGNRTMEPHEPGRLGVWELQTLEYNIFEVMDVLDIESSEHGTLRIEYKILTTNGFLSMRS